MNLASFSNLPLILFWLVPGFIIMYIRSQFLSGRTPSQSEMLLHSFIYSDPSERDIYIHYIYNIDENDKWRLRPGTGMLISAGEVSRIEFISQPSKEEAP